jgi:putative redox protein
VIEAATRLESVKAVATIGAPSDVAHVADTFADSIEAIESEGTARVTLAGRTFTIQKQFLDDIRSQNVLEAAKALHRPFLVCHAPLDETVSIDHASALFTTAKHPKSFLSLDKADHLLSGQGDAERAGHLIAGWACAHLPDNRPAAPEPDAATVATRETGTGKFTSHVVSGAHVMLGDEPERVGGDDAGPSPYDFLNAALGTCTVMTLRMYAERKGWDVGRLHCDVKHSRIHGEDCVDCETKPEGMVDIFERTLHLSDGLTAEQQEKLKEIADKCPVSKTLERSSKVRTHLDDAG